ncbi:MAG TPA: isoprenylcysteine carboxylmethyltransferase family protein [Candidatus Acidoferrum sp.]|nr:isoprenylcysteine carboxylmethyltransferase family protein [Candidatus Acidoferrum sp.]
MSAQHDRPRMITNPPIIVILALLLGWFLEWLQPIPFLSAPVCYYIGGVVFLLGLPLALPAVVQFWRARTSLIPYRPSTALVVKGPYRYSRNPLYIALTIHYLGIAIAARLPWAIVLIPVMLVLLTWWVIVPEENYLTAKFGEPYIRYRSQVRRWI